MTFISKFTNIIIALSIVLLFAFLLSTVNSSVVTAGSNDLLPHVHQDHDDDDDHDHEDHDEDGDDEDDDDHEEFEEEMMEMEMMHQIFEVTEDASRTSFFAIMLIDEVMEEEQAAELLQECLKETDSDKTKRAIRLKLTELYAEMDDQDAVRKHLKALIIGK